MAWHVARLVRSSSTGLCAASVPPKERGSSAATVWSRTVVSQRMPWAVSVDTTIVTGRGRLVAEFLGQPAWGTSTTMGC